MHAHTFLHSHTVIRTGLLTVEKAIKFSKIKSVHHHFRCHTHGCPTLPLSNTPRSHWLLALAASIGVGPFFKRGSYSEAGGDCSWKIDLIPAADKQIIIFVPDTAEGFPLCYKKKKNTLPLTPKDHKDALFPALILWNIIISCVSSVLVTKQNKKKSGYSGRNSGFPASN